MPRVQIYNPGYLIHCSLCDEFDAGVIIRKVGDTRIKFELCGQCLALAMQDITKQNWLSQWKTWRYISKLGKSIQGVKTEDATRQPDDK